VKILCGPAAVKQVSGFKGHWETGKAKSRVTAEPEDLPMLKHR